MIIGHSSLNFTQCERDKKYSENLKSELNMRDTRIYGKAKNISVHEKKANIEMKTQILQKECWKMREINNNSSFNITIKCWFAPTQCAINLAYVKTFFIIYYRNIRKLWKNIIVFALCLISFSLM